MMNDKINDKKVYWIWLQLVLGPSSHRSNAIVEQFESAKEIYDMNDEELLASNAFTPEEMRSLRSTPLGKAYAVAKRCHSLRCDVITPEDANYPNRLRNIFAMPLVLYVKGDINGIDEELAISMVGTRHCTEYGERAAAALASQLARYRVTVISGLAKGIDTCCLRAAIQKKGRTIAVIGSGIDVPYPKENTRAIEWMGRHAAVITEYPPGTPPRRFNFPQRNRIMSGLSLGTVVVEAGLKSGALITAAHALEQGKDVFAVPARFDDVFSLGALDLIKQGAKPVCCAEDILLEYEHLFPQKLKQIYNEQMSKICEQKKCEKAPSSSSKVDTPPLGKPDLPKGLSSEQTKICEGIGRMPASVQDLALKLEMSAHILLPLLTELEILGIIRSYKPGWYQLSKCNV